jgi:hypothetical protein
MSGGRFIAGVRQAGFSSSYKLIRGPQHPSGALGAGGGGQQAYLLALALVLKIYFRCSKQSLRKIFVFVYFENVFSHLQK